MSQLEQLKSELWALFDRMDKDDTGTGIKSGLVAAQAIVAKHTDGYELVPAGLDLDSFIEQTQQLLEKSKACAVNPDNRHKSEFYTGQSHGIEIVLDALRDVISDAFINQGWIRVDVRLPEQNGKYLCYFKNGDIALIEFQDGYFDAGEWRPTHWKALPLAPEQPK